LYGTENGDRIRLSAEQLLHRASVLNAGVAGSSSGPNQAVAGLLAIIDGWSLHLRHLPFSGWSWWIIVVGVLGCVF
jgi:hypothetical protein